LKPFGAEWDVSKAVRIVSMRRRTISGSGSV